MKLVVVALLGFWMGFGVLLLIGGCSECHHDYKDGGTYTNYEGKVYALKQCVKCGCIKSLRRVADNDG